MHSDNVHCLSLLLFVAPYILYSLILLPHTIWFTICCQMLRSLLFVGTTCHIVVIGFIPFVATCCTVYYSLSRSIQLLLMLHTVQFTSVAALRTVQYSLPHAMQFAICCHVSDGCYWCCMSCSLLLLSHSIQYNIHCRMPCSLMFVVACAIQVTIRCHVPYNCYWCCIPCSLLLLLHSV